MEKFNSEAECHPHSWVGEVLQDGFGGRSVGPTAMKAAATKKRSAGGCLDNCFELNLASVLELDLTCVSDWIWHLSGTPFESGSQHSLEPTFQRSHYLRTYKCPYVKLWTTVYLSNTWPPPLKLRQNTFQTIPNVLFLDLQQKDVGFLRVEKKQFFAGFNNNLRS